MKTSRLLVSLCAVALSVVSSNAMVLVDEGVVLGEGGYSNADKTSFSLNDVTGGLTASTGFATDHWLGTTGVLVSRTAGLAFPSDFTGKMDPSGAGALGFRGESGAANWNATSGQTQTDNYRNQYRKTVALNGAAGEKRYFRALVYADSDAMSQLYQKDGWLSWRNGYNVGLVTPISEMAYSTSVMDCPRYLHFSCYRNTSVSPAVNEIAFVVKGKEGTAKRFKVCDMTAGHTYLCVAEATLGDGPDTFRVFAHDCSSSAPLDMDNLPWVACEFEGVTFDLFDSSDDLHLFIGGQYKTTGNVRFDEMRVGTTLNDVVPVSAKYVTVGSMSVDNLTTESADLSAGIEMKGVASAVPELSYGLSESELTEKTTLSAITADGTVTAQLTGLQPVTTYYYQWRVTADGVNPAEGPVSSFVTKGMPVFGEMTVGGSPATGGSYAQVMLTEAGIAATKVECWCGQSADKMSVIKAWEDVQSGTVLVATNTAAQFGNTDYFKFVASFEYESTPYEYESSLSYVLLSGTGLWTGTAADGLWQTAGNWDLKAVPNENLAVVFEKSGFAAAEDAALAAKSLTVRKDKSNVTLDLKGTTTLQIPESITLGSDTGTQSYGCSLTMTGGVVTVGGNLNIPCYGTRGNWCSMTMVGTKMSADNLNLYSNNDSGNNNSLSLRNGAVLSVNSVSVAYLGTLSLDASIVTNSGKFAVAYNAKAGTLTLDHGSYFRQKDSSECGLGGKGTGTMTVKGGSTFDASGCSFGLGGLGDGGTYSSTLTITDGVFMASALTMPKSGSYKGTQTLNIRTGGRMSLTGNMTVGSSDSKVRDSGSSVVNVADGTLEVGGTLALGTASDRRVDTLNVSGENARVMAASVSCMTNAVLKFTLPENGFANAVVETTGNLSLCSTAGWPTTITIDATACKSGAWQTLLKSGTSLQNVSPGQVTVTGTYKNHEYDIKVTETELKFRVRNMSSGTVIIYR